MKNIKHFILIVVISFLVMITLNPLVIYADSSSSNNNFVFYLPMGIVIAAILAGVINAIEKIIKGNK